jgi:hypothetical protein
MFLKTNMNVGNNFLILTHQAPLMEIFKADPSTKVDSSEPLGLGTRVELRFQHGVSLGEVFYDLRPQFPCFALFLDSQNALVLSRRPRSKDGSDNGYMRVGIARFLRTMEQRDKDPFWGKDGKLPAGVPWGPATEHDARSFVTIY